MVLLTINIECIKDQTMLTMMLVCQSYKSTGQIATSIKTRNLSLHRSWSSLQQNSTIRDIYIQKFTSHLPQSFQ